MRTANLSYRGRWALRYSENSAFTHGLWTTAIPIPLMIMAIASQQWQIIASIAATLCVVTAAMTMKRYPVLSRRSAFLSAAISLGGLFPHLIESPFRTLIGSVVAISLFFSISNAAPRRVRKAEPSVSAIYRAYGSVLLCLATIIALHILRIPKTTWIEYTLGAEGLLSQSFLFHWTISKPGHRHSYSFLSAALIYSSLHCLFFMPSVIETWIVVTSIPVLLMMTQTLIRGRNRISWYDTFINQPARLLISTFFILCVLGSLLLILPIASRVDISPIDAVFTAVSAVCVTGLVVLNTPTDFTAIGQVCILILIQLGGLGIMGIATVSFHALGYRLSIRQEKLVSSIVQTDRGHLIESLIRIVKVTFAFEGIGFVLLCFLFHLSGDSFGMAAWRGLFTSVSAFCNAGFALQGDSLVRYQSDPLILYTISMLIIAGGLAPVTILAIPAWIRKEHITAGNVLALWTSIGLLVIGTLSLLALEWNGILGPFSIAGKIHNAWFQSVTLRTAGFNSVPLEKIRVPTMMIMIIFMFIGGNPGGTAGGIKTTTISVLLLTFWSRILNQKHIIVHKRRVLSSTITKSIAILFAGFFIWIATAIMLLITQDIPAREILFETTSAIGTVGLSIGATAKVDQIGKVILILAMFLGRIGPLTMFAVLSMEEPTADSEYPNAHISFT